MNALKIHNTAEWATFAEANRDALLEMYPSLTDAMTAACQGGIHYGNAATETLVVFVDEFDPTYGYDVDESNIIRSPGKFEGEPRYVPYFFDAELNGAPDDELDDSGTLVTVFKITEEDVGLYPELANNVDRFICLWESDDGFAYHDIISRDGLGIYIADIESRADSDNGED